MKSQQNSRVFVLLSAGFQKESNNVIKEWLLCSTALSATWQIYVEFFFFYRFTMCKLRSLLKNCSTTKSNIRKLCDFRGETFLPRIFPKHNCRLECARLFYVGARTQSPPPPTPIRSSINTFVEHR